MANPLIVVCPEKEWTKVATAITTGFIRRPLDMGQFSYRWTYRDTGGVVPDNNDASDGGNAQLLFTGSDNNVEMSFPSPADVYVRPRDSDDKSDVSANVSVALP
jgi:hypothetical protein